MKKNANKPTTKSKAPALAGKLQRMVRFFHFRIHIHSVWGVGIAMGPAGMSAVSEDWKYLANIIEWKVFLGPILLRGVFPYRIRPYKKPTYCQQSNAEHHPRPEAKRKDVA
jgi:hypothetical protein